MNEQVLMAIIAEDIKDDLIDALIQLPEISGFNLQSIDGYSREHGQYDLREQVAGFRRLCRIEVIHSKQQEAKLLDALSTIASASPTRYWIMPIQASGHLPGERHDKTS
jgi:hypothetical protein